MSTSFKVKTQRTDISFITTDMHFSAMEEPDIALRFWGGTKHRQTVRFAFPRELIEHLRDIVLCGSDGSEATIGELFDECHTCDFLNAKRSDDFLAWGSKHPQPADIERFLV